MKKPAIPKKLLDKRIPTLLGMFVLVVALIAGTLLLGEGPGVFAPRATPSTTPKKIKVTNVTDNSFTISFLTDESTPAFVKYGTSASDLKSQSSDDRDQLSGTVGDYKMHHITVRGLQQSTQYHYTLGTGSGSSFDNGGVPFTLTTAARNGAPAAAKTIYGSVSNQAGNPAEGAVVYISLAEAGEMSSLVKKSGSWAIPLSNARTKNGSSYAQLTDQDNVILSIQGEMPSETIIFQTIVADAQPVPTLSFGKELPESTVDQTAVVEDTVADEAESYQEETYTASDEAETVVDDYMGMEDDYMTDDFDSTDEAETTDVLLDELDNSFDSSQSATSEADLAQPTESKIVDTSKVEAQKVTTTQPKIIGKAKPGVTITIQVHSDTQIQQDLVADGDGNFELDIATLSQNLEPGEHEVTYSYIDPDSGETVEKTVYFTVEATADTLDQPYGSGNPYPPETPLPTATPEASESAEASQSAEASESAEATDSGRESLPATDEAVPVSGSVGTTLALVFGGLFFIVSGLWSFWISHQLGKDELRF